MKNILLLLLLFFILFPQHVFAHGAGFPPFFKINGTLANVYPLQAATTFIIPQDLAHESFVKDTDIHFEIDAQALSNVFQEDVIKNTKFEWDFGDGTKGTGMKNSHKYTKTGSLMVTINAAFPNQPGDSVLIESVQLNILPDKNYKLPQPVIKVNAGKKIANPLQDAVAVDLNNDVIFDASDSKAPSSKIVSFEWDFGDGKKSNKTKTSHSYKLPQFYITPALRIIDDKGFIVDTPINLKNSGKNEENNVEPTDDMRSSFPVSPIIIQAGLIVVAAIAVFVIKKRFM